MDQKYQQKPLKAKSQHLSKQTNSNSQRIYLKHPAPHSRKQELIMNAFMFPDLRELWVACGSKFGKTLSGSVALSKLACVRNNLKLRWIAPIYRQSLLGMEYFNNLLPPKPHSEFKKGAMLVNMPFSKNVIEFWHGQDPFSLEGAAVHGDVLDECAKMKEQVYISERTTKIRTKGPSVFLSTPLGKTWFFNKCMDAKEHQEWAIRNGRRPTKIFLTARTIDNPFIDPEVIDEARKELPERLFLQHYEAMFIDDGTVFTNISACIYTEKLLVEGARQKWFHADAKNRSVVIGVDWAKQKDWTVFFAADMEHRIIVGFERFHQIPYTEQIRKLALFARKFKSVEVCFHDKTGVGSAIDDHLAYLGFPYHGITFNNQIKAEMVAKLITSLEQEYIRYPYWEVLTNELTAYELKTSPTGLPVYNAPSGKHDDTVVALILVNVALLEYSDRDYQINYLEDLKNETPDSDSLESYYNDLIEDED
jgi:hypothetical protein